MEASNSLTKEELQMELITRKARKNFWAFCLYWDYDFFKPREKILKPIAMALNNGYYSEKEHYKILISIFPRAGKSYTSNLFKGWCIGKDRDRLVLTASYSKDISTSLHIVVRQMIEDDRYRAVFDDCVPEFLEDTKTTIHFKGHSRPSLVSTSVGGGVTGKGASIMITDDIYKGMTEALSDSVNNETIAFYNTEFSTRGEGRILEVIIGTRWTTKEVAAVLLKDNYFDEVLVFPALKNDRSICEEAISTERVLDMQDKLTPAEFNALYQQEPQVSEHSLVTPTNIDWVDPEDYKVESRFILIDPKTKGKDYFACPCIAITNIGLVLEDVVFTDQVLDDSMEAKLVHYINHYKPYRWALESNKDYSLYRNLNKNTLSRGMEFASMTNKETKILQYSRFIFKIKFVRNNDSEYMAFMTQLYSYDPHIANKHDDAIDSLVMAIMKLLENPKLGGQRWLDMNS